MEMREWLTISALWLLLWSAATWLWLLYRPSWKDKAPPLTAYMPPRPTDRPWHIVIWGRQLYELQEARAMGFEDLTPWLQYHREERKLWDLKKYPSHEASPLSKKVELWKGGETP